MGLVRDPTQWVLPLKAANTELSAPKQTVRNPNLCRGPYKISFTGHQSLWVCPVTPMQWQLYIYVCVRVFCVYIYANIHVCVRDSRANPRVSMHLPKSTVVSVECVICEWLLMSLTYIYILYIFRNAKIKFYFGNLHSKTLRKWTKIVICRVRSKLGER